MAETIPVLIELDRIRASLMEPGQPFEMADETVGGIPMRVYKNLPRNLSHFIVKALDYSDRTFIVSGARRLTYTAALGRAAGLAQIFAATYGVGPGTRVAIASRNSAEWVLAYLATFLAGATAVLINSRGTADEIAHALRDTECAVLVADGKRAAAAAGFQGRIITADETGDFRDDGRVLEAATATPCVSDAALDDPAIIMFTSGTSGRPKGAVLTHRSVGTFLFQMRHNTTANLIRTAGKMGVEPAVLAASAPQQATLAIFPFFHISGAAAMVLGGLVNGGKLVMLDRWDAAAALSLIEKERITILQGPPSIFWDLLACPNLATTDLSSLTNAGTGGQATPANLQAAMTRAFPNAAASGGWGMTETSGSISSGYGEEYLANPKASGRVMPGNEVRVVDDHGNDLSLGGIGEIWVRGPLVTAGYWNQPEANAAAFSDGWFKTGDVGFLDADRFITIVDRKKEMIIRGGENIYCAELERVFQEYPGVLEVAAFGVPDERWGERAVLAVVPQPGIALAAKEMEAFGRARFADYKVPSEFVFMPEPLHRNAVGKVDKAALRRNYAALTG